MFDWVNASLNRKIGSILAVSLSFLLIVIGYSIYQIRMINDELKEVAHVDIPLTEVITQVEMLQLQQHLSVERYRLLMQKGHNEKNSIESFFDRHQAISRLLDRATLLVTSSFENDTIQFKPAEYQLILDEIKAFSDINNNFKVQLKALLINGSLPDEMWEHLESTASTLDKNIVIILEQISQLTKESTQYTEEHQRGFMLIETSLGICALILSSLLAVYVLHVIRSRIRNIHLQVERLHTSLEQGVPIIRPDEDSFKPSDELGELELDLKKMISRLSDEMDTRKEVEQQLIILATKDKLTDTYNRHKWSEQIQLLIGLSDQNTPFSVISLDVDHFKKVNDNYGHQVGDKVLQQLANLLQKDIVKPDMVFRMGGEEFLLLLTKQGLTTAAEIAERLRHEIETFQTLGLPKFTVSMGVTEYRAGETENQLMTRADEALYKSKENGRNRITTMP